MCFFIGWFLMIKSHYILMTYNILLIDHVVLTHCALFIAVGGLISENRWVWPEHTSCIKENYVWSKTEIIRFDDVRGNRNGRNNESSVATTEQPYFMIFIIRIDGLVFHFSVKLKHLSPLSLNIYLFYEFYRRM